MFSGRPSVRACVRPCFRACVRDSRGSFMFPRCLQYLLTDFRQTFITGASRDRDELIRFWGQKVKGQGHSMTDKISNGRISGTGRPIDFAFDPRVGFSGTADRMDLLPVSPNLRRRLLMTSSRNSQLTAGYWQNGWLTGW